MKCKTSITLSVGLLKELDRRIGPEGNRSQALEQALREYLERLTREEREAADLEILNRRAEELNEQALDALDYQGAE